MIMKRIISVFILTIFSITIALFPRRNISSDNQYYFPMVVKYVPNIEAIVSKRYNLGQMSDYFIYGYVLKFSNDPYYSTFIVVDLVGNP